MGRREKLIARFLDQRKDFTWDELVRLLRGQGSRKPRRQVPAAGFRNQKAP